MHWVIIITFALGDPALPNMQYSHIHTYRLYDQVVQDKHGRAVLFNNLKQCENVAVQVVDKMLMDTKVRPLQYRCVRAEVSK